MEELPLPSAVIALPGLMGKIIEQEYNVPEW